VRDGGESEKRPSGLNLAVHGYVPSRRAELRPGQAYGNRLVGDGNLESSVQASDLERNFDPLLVDARFVEV